jgi:8-oxo-dGTP pyrophosphatase MutT (NUDIX family)
MGDPQKSPDPNAAARELLLADYRYLADSFWKNEQTGETRVNLFIGFATFVIGSVVTLWGTAGAADQETMRVVAVGCLLSLLLLGIVTLMRILKRNAAADRYKLGCDKIRQTFKDHFDTETVLDRYYPAGAPLPRRFSDDKPRTDEEDAVRAGVWKRFWRCIWRRVPKKWRIAFRDISKIRKFGGLSHMVLAMNCIFAAGAVCLIAFPITGPGEAGRLVLAYVLSGVTFLVAFIVQFLYVCARERRSQEELLEDCCTHAGGVVYRVEDQALRYLLVESTCKNNQWVLPKGHIEDKEGDIETARREVCEETGQVARAVCVVDVVEFKVSTKVPNTDPVQFTTEDVCVKYYLMEWLYEAKAIENRKIEWFTLDEALVKLKELPEARYVIAAAEAKRTASRLRRD